MLSLENVPLFSAVGLLVLLASQDFRRGERMGYADALPPDFPSPSTVRAGGMSQLVTGFEKGASLGVGKAT